MRTKTVVPLGRPDRIIRLYEPIDSTTVRPVIEALLSFDHDGADPVVLHVSSPGGCVSSGLSLIDVMHHIQAPVFVVASGVVASMAAVILASGEHGYRYALPHARVMIHPSSGRAAGRLEVVQSATRFHGELEREIEKILLAATQLPQPRLRRLLRQERFLSAKESQQLGIVDHVL